MTSNIIAELVRLSRIDELDQEYHAITIPDGLTNEQSFGAMLIAQQVLDHIEERKKALRYQPTKLL